MRESIVIAVALSFILAGPVLARPPQAAAKPGAAAAAKPMTMSITGIVAKTEQGYIIRGQEPPELFTILNPNAHVLDSLVKGGKSVTIEALSVMGDNVKIQKIDDKAYQEAKPGNPDVK
jgi:hypothetical protein